MKNSNNPQAIINHLSWLFAMVGEDIKLVDQVSAPIYADIDIVLSNDFCSYETEWKKIKFMYNTITQKYRKTLSTGIINLKFIKNNFSPYPMRMKMLSLNCERLIMNLYRASNRFTSNKIRFLINAQKRLTKALIVLEEEILTI